MCWHQGRSTTASTPTLSSGTGPTTRCDSGSPSTLPEFVARLRARPTSRVAGDQLEAAGVVQRGARRVRGVANRPAAHTVVAEVGVERFDVEAVQPGEP